VGTKSEEETIESLKSLVPALLMSEDSPETRAILATLGPEIRALCNVSQKVVSRKRSAVSGQLVPPGGAKKQRRK